MDTNRPAGARRRATRKVPPLGAVGTQSNSLIGGGYESATYTLQQLAAASAAPAPLAREALTLLVRELSPERAGLRMLDADEPLSLGSSPDASAAVDRFFDRVEALWLETPGQPAGLIAHSDPRRRRGALTPQILNELQAEGFEAFYPLVCGERLLGAIVMGPAEGGLDEASLRFLEIVGHIVTERLSNSVLTDDVEQSQSVISRADRLSSVGAMTAGLAHEIRNPLVSLRAFTQLLPERYDDAEFRDSFLELTLGEIDRVCVLVGELLAFARGSWEDVTGSCDAGECLEGIGLLLGSQAESHGIGLKAEGTPPGLRLGIDGNRLKQIVTNVSLNAIQACDADGLVTLGAKACEVDGEPWVSIEITDDGCGMDEATINRLYEPFFTTRPEGTGLGLSIVKQLVEENGGTIDVESEPGLGTKFSINFPALVAKAAEAQPAAAKKAASAKPTRKTKARSKKKVPARNDLDMVFDG